MEHEISFGASTRVLSQVQSDIFLERLQNKELATYEFLIKKYSLSGPNSLITCFIRTVSGRYWEPGYKGGTDPYLSELDTKIFIEKIKDASDDINCLTLNEAESIAFDIKTRRIKAAALMLEKMKLSKLMIRLEIVSEPSHAWINSFAEKNGYKICKPQELERLRRFYCDKNSIEKFLNENKNLFNRDPRLIFNADETQLDTKKKFKVIVERGKIPLKTVLSKLPHITAMITICGNGTSFKPLIILPKLKSLKGLEELCDFCFFSTSQTGWMNKNLFLVYSIIFCHQLSQYRMNLPQELRNQRVLLVVDGHKSRINFLAVKVFDLFNVDLLILPGHTSHLLQPFDVSVASPLKIAFKTALDAKLREFEKIEFKKGEKTSKLRFIIICAFLDALQKSTTRTNIISGFEKSGFIPFNPNSPLSSVFAMNEIYNVQAPALNINGHLITTKEYQLKLMKEHFKIDVTMETLDFYNDKCFKYGLLLKAIQDTKQEDFLISKIPELWINKNGSYVGAISSQNELVKI